MSPIFRVIGFLLLSIHVLNAHMPRPCAKENKYLVSQSVLTLHEECSEQSSYTSQTIYGHLVQVIEEKGNGWALIETEDGYQGYVLMAGVMIDDPRWRTSKRLYRTRSIGAMIYPAANIERAPFARLPFDSRIELISDLESNDHTWLEVQLLGGKRGWIQRGDIEKIEVKSLGEMINLSHKFVELPYIWGGDFIHWIRLLGLCSNSI